MKSKMKFEWIEIGGSDYRAKVRGGWLVKSCELLESVDYNNYTSSIAFVPDENHEWEIGEEEESRVCDSEQVEALALD